MIDRVRLLPAVLALSTLMLVVSGCGSSSDCCTVIDVDVTIHYQTEQGENLINSEDSYDQSNIKIYYKNGNTFDYVFNSNLDNPNNHEVIAREDGSLMLTIFPSYYYEGNQSTTLIALNENTVDTLVCEFSLDGNSEICTGAWLNGIEFENRFLAINK